MTDTLPTPLDPQADPGQLGPYRVTGLLARGGMGRVYGGEHVETGEEVALKTVREVTGHLLAGFRREIHALGRVRHPGIVRILAHDFTGGLPWIAMPLLKGATLRQHLDELWPRPASVDPRRDPAAGESDTANLLTAPLGGAPRVVLTPAPSAPARPLGPTLTLMRRLCAPLAFLHGEGLVHRDLKPANVFLQDDGSPVLVDLGIVVHFGGAGGREELEVDPIMGTLQYMAPEQLGGELCDARADLYALGCILYECVTGQPPFTGENAAVIRQHLEDLPLPPSLRAPGLPAELDRLILQLLKKRPQDRLGHAADVAAALVALDAEAEPEDGPAPRPYLYRPEITGREGALATLEEAALRLSRERRGGIVLIRGESGVGKTRLAMEMGRRAAKRPLTVLTGRGMAPGAGGPSAQAGVAPPLHLLRPVLLEIADLAHEGHRAAIEWLLSPRGRVLATYEPNLRHLPGHEEQPAPAPLPPEQARALVIAALRETLRVLAERSPIVLVLDDLQWADELSLSLLAALAEAGSEERRVLLVGTYRSEESRPELEGLARAPGVTTIALDRLDAPSVEAMISGMLGLRARPFQVIEALVGHSTGNPFFVAEYLRAAIGEGMLRRDEGGQWRFDAGGDPAAAISSLPLPHTLVELVERRLRGLDAGGRALLAWAAVLGQELDDDLLLLDARDDGTALEALEALRVRHLLEETPEGRLRFAHDKIREIAYEQIAEAERIALHRRAGEALEARHPLAPDMAAAIGHHCARAGLHGKAGRHFARAADRAREVYVNGDAIRFYQSAIAELTQAPPGEAAREEMPPLHERLGDVLGLVGRWEDAREAYGAALEMAPPPPCVELARIHRKIGKAWDTQQRYPEALDRYALAEAALGSRPRAPAEVWGDEWLQIQIDRISVYYSLADFERVRQRVEAIRPAVERNGTARQRAGFLQALTKMSIQRERYVASAQTVRWVRDGLSAFEAAGDAHGIMTLRCDLAIILLLRGTLDKAETQIDAALRAAERLGDLAMQSRCLTYWTVLQRRMRRVGTAGSLAERSLAVSRAAQMSQYIGASLGNLAWLAVERGDMAGAERAGREALSHWEPLSLVYPFQWLARLPLAHVELARDHLEGAMDQVRVMLDVQQQRLPDRLTAALTAAEAASAEGHVDRAHQALSRALRMARRLGYA